MNDVQTGNMLEMIIIAILIVDVLLEWKMVYGCYPWEASMQS